MAPAPLSSPPEQPWIMTPLVPSPTLSRIAGCNILLKLENLQPSGSFKSRGIGHYMLTALAARAPNAPPPHFYASSGGNAGLACVYAARSLQLPATIVVPETTTAFMQAKLRAAGATAVIQRGASWSEADAYLRRDLLANDAAAGVYVPPFDDGAIWAGNSGCIEELRDQMPYNNDNGGSGARIVPDGVVCAVGGGGLLVGIVEGLERNGWWGGSTPGGSSAGTTTPTTPTTQVFAVETEGAESLAKSLEAGRVVSLESISSIATSLVATRVCDRAFEVGGRDGVRSVVLSDAEAARAAVSLVADERLAVEVACGAALALAYRPGYLGGIVGRDGTVVVIVCGGSNVSVAKLAEWEEKYGGGVEGEAVDGEVEAKVLAGR
ncbi:MAG: hypothetical protein M1825_000274 [Sarcosagium campestre]|nr:MAG: hypothetical protein M1825_000274 [Sarcosagium campestre]